MSAVGTVHARTPRSGAASLRLPAISARLLAWPLLAFFLAFYVVPVGLMLVIGFNPPLASVAPITARSWQLTSIEHC